MLMNSKTIHSEMMKNDTLGFDDESNKKNGPGCHSGDCSFRILYFIYFIYFVHLLQQFGTENT